MAEYTNVEYTNMTLIYGETGQNSLVAKNLSAERFPHRRYPSAARIVKAVHRLRATGSVIQHYEDHRLERLR